MTLKTSAYVCSRLGFEDQCATSFALACLLSPLFFQYFLFRTVMHLFLWRLAPSFLVVGLLGHGFRVPCTFCNRLESLVARSGSPLPL